MFPTRTIEVPDESAIRTQVSQWMSERKVTYAELGKVIGMASGNLYNVIKSNRRMTEPMAKRLYKGMKRMEEQA